MIEINDLNIPELNVYRMSEAQLRHYPNVNEGMLIAESPKVILSALDAGCIPVSLLVEKKHLETQAKAVIERCTDLPIYCAEFDVLTQLTGYQLVRGMLCAMKRPQSYSVQAICEQAKRIVVLENVMNPTNIGAIFRNAAALNMDAILLTKGCSDPYYRRSIRVSMGCVFQIPWAFVEDPIDILHQYGFKTAAMALRNETISMDDPQLVHNEKLAVLLGTEGKD